MSNFLSSHSLSLVQGGSPVWDGGWELSWHLCFSVPLSVSPLGLAHWKRSRKGLTLTITIITWFFIFWVRQKFQDNSLVSWCFHGLFRISHWTFYCITYLVFVPDFWPEFLKIPWDFLKAKNLCNDNEVTISRPLGSTLVTRETNHEIKGLGLWGGPDLWGGEAGWRRNSIPWPMI